MADKNRPWHYVCAQCGKPGIPDVVTRIDDRYTTGKCSGDHKGMQYLVAENVTFVEKKRKRKKKEKE